MTEKKESKDTPGNMMRRVCQAKVTNFLLRVMLKLLTRECVQKKHTYTLRYKPVSLTQEE